MKENSIVVHKFTKQLGIITEFVNFSIIIIRWCEGRSLVHNIKNFIKIFFNYTDEFVEET